jgi:hypothetical protein
MFKKLIHTRSACRLFSLFGVFVCASLWILGGLLNPNGGLIIITGLSFFATVIATIAHFCSTCFGAGDDCINLSQPHTAILAKDDNGNFIIEVCQFPFWDFFEGNDNTEAGALKEYDYRKKRDEEKHKKKCESGPVRVITEPVAPKHADKDAFEHIAEILKQYAPEQVEAIRKLKEVFDKE